jgi:hypothetical protein
MSNLEHDRVDHKVVRNRLNNYLLEDEEPAHLDSLYSTLISTGITGAQSLASTRSGSIESYECWYHYLGTLHPKGH